MRFYLGETYQKHFLESRRVAIVVALADEGRRATLRFVDTEETLNVAWTEFKNQKWRRVTLDD